MSDSQRTSWVKWTIASLIGIAGAGGGLVAGLRYMDDRTATAELEYQEALRVWSDFAPPRDEWRSGEVELLAGWYLDLDRGLVAMSLTGESWDIRFRVESGSISPFIGIEANSRVEWADLGTVDFGSLSYRQVRDARFTSTRPGRGDKYLYYAHTTAAPGAGYVYLVKTPTGTVAKVQIVRYLQNTGGTRGIALRYEAYPIVSDPPRPQRRR